MPKQKEVIISVTNGKISVDQDPVYVSIRNIEEVMWRCYQYEIEIIFDQNDTPFLAHHFKATKAGACCSGVPRDGTARSKEYKYSVAVIMRGNERLELDPKVIVE
jgi:hypothetical protein